MRTAAEIRARWRIPALREAVLDAARKWERAEGLFDTRWGDPDLAAPAERSMQRLRRAVRALLRAECRR